ncbi:MAG TPA: dCTP deaminase, partial [Enteractinococcus sp.]
MILTGSEIEREVSQGRIQISGFDPARLSTNSYDLSLGSTLLRYTDAVVDPRANNSYSTFKITSSGYRMQQNEFLLGESQEYVGSDHYVPIIHAKSGTARLGLFVHVTADLIDIGSHGKITFQLYSTLPVILYAEWRIAQVSFWVPEGDITLYDG